MNRPYRTLAHVFVIVLLIGSIMTLSTSVAVAQENTPHNSTQNATATETANAANDDSNESSSVIKIGPEITLKDYRFDSDFVYLTIEADYSKIIKISSMTVSGSGARQIPQKTVMLDSGTNELKFKVQTWKGVKAVGVASAGGAIVISEEAGGSTFTSQYDATTLITMGITGVLTGIGLVFVVAFKRRFDYSNSIKRVL